ncbi:MAG: sigma 54 modulation/S30EA ribosomal C-terminal domain-containing protein, partial [Miltoncostaeaceae bacterium]
EQARGAQEAEAPPASGPEPKLVKEKRFVLQPMDPEDAAHQMDLVEHDFFVFRNDRTDEVNVVYRRRDGDYGLIVPQE